MSSLDFFPTNKKGFDKNNYGIKLNRPIVTNAPNGEVGIEVELEGRGLNCELKTEINGVRWTMHEDGSLRNGGREFVLSDPCEREDVTALVEGLFSDLWNSKASLNLSKRTSTHVHINVKNMTINQLCSFVCLWGIYEELFTNWCGEHRVGNLFCLRMKDASGLLDKWEQAFKTGEFFFSPEHVKYSALNPACLRTIGSLEFRCLRGCDEPSTIIKWVNLLLRLKDKAINSYSNPKDISVRFSGMDSQGFLEHLIGDLPIFDEILNVNQNQVTSSGWEGFRMIQPLLYVIPWDDLMKEFSKGYVPNPFEKEDKRPDRVIRNENMLAINNPILFRDQMEALIEMPQPMHPNFFRRG